MEADHGCLVAPVTQTGRQPLRDIDKSNPVPLATGALATTFLNTRQDHDASDAVFRMLVNDDLVSSTTTTIFSSFPLFDRNIHLLRE